MYSDRPNSLTSDDVPWHLTPDELYLQFTNEVSTAEIAGLVSSLGLIVVQPKLDAPTAAAFHHWVRVRNGDMALSALAQLRGDPRVSMANRVFHRSDLLPKKTGFSYRDLVVIEFSPSADVETWLATHPVTDITEVNGIPKEAFDESGRIRILRIDRSQLPDALDAAELFRTDPSIADASPDWVYLPSSLAQVIPPTDEYYTCPGCYPMADQWNLKRVNAEDAWAITTGSVGVKIAVIDTGCHVDHEDLGAGRFVPIGQRYPAIPPGAEDVHGHGTWVSGVLGASTNNVAPGHLAATGIAAVAWSCKLMPIRVIALPSNEPSDFDLAQGIHWARMHGARVINMSIAIEKPKGPCLSCAALTSAGNHNIVMVAATGNDGSTPGHIGFPASHPGVLAVGASDRSDQRAKWAPGVYESQYGVELGVVAPGVDIPTTFYWAAYGYEGYWSTWGTSFATPHVAGLAALIRSKYPTLSSARVVEIIQRSADRVGLYPYTDDSSSPSPTHPHGYWHEEMGYGRINMEAALILAATF